MTENSESNTNRVVSINAGISGSIVNSISRKDTGRFGIAVLVPYYANRNCAFFMEIYPEHPEQIFRLEAHGSVTRMQKAYIELDAQGVCTYKGEEIDRYSCDSDGKIIRINFNFRPHQTREEWFYIFCCDPSPNSSRFEVGHLKCQSDSPPTQPRKGLHFRVNATAWYQNYLQIDFELVSHERELSGLRLKGPSPFETVQWWTWQTPTTPPSGPDWLVARRPRNALPSPAAMEQWGPDFGWHGHSIRALHGELIEVTAMSIQESDRMLEELRLEAVFTDGSTEIFEPRSSLENSLSQIKPFIEDIARQTLPAKPRFLELGARGLHSAELRAALQEQVDYLGVDIHPDPNVDLVADAHHLSDLVAWHSIDIFFSHSVLEHLLMPWKVVVEANRVMRPGGLFMAFVPISCALHAEPWDYWRISPHAWPALLNRHTGFEIIWRHEVGRAAIVPLDNHVTGLSRMPYDPAPIYGVVVARKIGEASADWTGYSADLATGRYDP